VKDRSLYIIDKREWFEKAEKVTYGKLIEIINEIGLEVHISKDISRKIMFI